MKKLFIVDAVNFLFRSYYAISPMTNAQGESTHALFGLIRSLYKIINEFSPDYFIAVFDGPDNKRSRTQIYSEYKSHRKRMPDDLVPQLERSLEFCEIAGIPHLSIPGVEADDTIGSIARWMEKKGTEITLCSSDKDLCQLVSSHIRILNPHKNNLLIDRKGVQELFGILPEQMIDYLAIVGDASDNIPGLPGFGPKTASALLKKYDSLEGIFAAVDDFQGKKREALEKGQETALMSQQLATIQTDIPFPHEDSFFHLKEPDLDTIKAFYQEMRFLSLLKELGEEPSKKAISKGKGDYHLVDDEKTLQELVRTLKDKKRLCIDTEATSTSPLLAELVGIGLGCQEGQAWYIPLNGHLKQKALSLLKPLLTSPDIEWIGHNIKYDLHVLQHMGISLGSIYFDTMLASYLTNPHTQRHGLDNLTLEKFGVAKTPISSLIGKGKEEKTIDKAPIADVSNYCCEDVDYTWRLYELFSKEIKELKLTKVFEEIEMPLLPILAQMEQTGIYCDAALLQKISKELNAELETLTQLIYELAGESFNINSPRQLSHILFDKMGINPPKKTATGFSTAIDVLESLQEEVPLVKAIIHYRTLEKLRSTYVDALPQQIHPETGRIHCSFNQSVAATGRLSCNNPNLQNIPVRSKEGKRIREAFKPQRKGYSFLSADYSQIELRLLAHFSDDPTLLKAFKAEEDIHAHTASLIFNTSLNKVTADMRHRAKAVNFGILYGQQAFGLSKQLGISYSEADQFIKTYFKRHPQVELFLESCKESARKTGKAFTLTGRQRPIPEISSKNPALRAAAERLAINTPLQGTTADLIKLAMIQVNDYLLEHPDRASLILQIHDELLFELPDNEIDRFKNPLKKIMEGIFDLKISLTIDICVGKNWGEC